MTLGRFASTLNTKYRLSENTEDTVKVQTFSVFKAILSNTTFSLDSLAAYAQFN